MRPEWPELGEKVDSMYLNNKYTQKREKYITRKVGKGEIKQFTSCCLSL